ncbi:MAG: 30S ribosomal protein S9 [SAR202 cluster bacterium]|nr:30S ribosomal protein S9 [SAR202 cluster bacterium]|tara:strand:- start:8976 stop:9371 length:396 start_codon:yes stop_codon:yes gene_type:complete
MAEQNYYYGTGKRKTAIAQVRIYPGQGQITINEKPIGEVFPRSALQSVILEPMKLTSMANKFNIVAKVHGGGVTSQAGAMRHGIARALLVSDVNLRPVLKQNKMLTRDDRIKESKKYGLKRARRAKQYTKR